ncbi:hypothetical protein CEUSTIGMA_g515.t1 [Chlamydomonas eustigma]|uniref:L-dopachrome isomerase n=1 Tax=Chlamydomonas eustigma TaxID=1157962 RepID=A0A250WQW6_9CHLO|nr:hypothetical protein CEUSTIGMA_g515.t1 [Chlamydomonas eustigma]|eukprot:GAX73062.1 hypothetical protein CEUSTIGMA_g515.t1 [Chlamydomonas eustigma]
MPIITINTSTVSALEAKLQLMTELNASFAEELKIPSGHVHIHVLDGQCFAFGGDSSRPGAYITIKASALQIWPEVRRDLALKLTTLIQKHLDVPAERTTTMFEELPVENIAVGSNIAVFVKSPTAAATAEAASKAAAE